MSIVIGMDLGDKKNFVVVLDKDGNELVKKEILNNSTHITAFLSKYPGAALVIESSTHSAWIARLADKLGHKVCVSNPRKVRTIWDTDDKTDERDARTLAFLYRSEPRLLYPIKHKGEESQRDLVLIKSREQLLKNRTQLINYCRSTVKGFGKRISSCSADSFHKKALVDIPKELMPMLETVLEMIETLTIKMKELLKKIDALTKRKYQKEASTLQQVNGVGPITSLAYILTIEEPNKFKNSRSVGAFLGLTPRRDQSGNSDKQLAITKAGNSYLRQLLVNCSNYIMGPFGQDCELKRYGERIASRGGKNARKRAKIAVARKLSVILHRLWQDKAVYDPFYSKKKKCA